MSQVLISPEHRSRVNHIASAFFNPVTVSVCSVVRCCFTMKKLATNSMKTMDVLRILVFRMLHAKASLTAICCMGFSKEQTACGLKIRCAKLHAILEEDAINHNRQTDTHHANEWECWSRVAVLCWATIDWTAIRGGSKRRPTPMPSTIWKPTSIPMDVVALKNMKNPFPTVARAVPM